MVEEIKYSRETAVEEGLRFTTEINKGYFKRPALRMLKKNITITIGKNKRFIGTTHELAINKTLELPSQIKYGSTRLFEYFNHDKTKFKLAERLFDNFETITLKEVDELGSFKSKTVYGYIEKQHNNIYTIRNLNNVLDNVIDIQLNEFYDIAGKAVLFSLSKKNGICKVHHILNPIETNKSK